MTDKMARHMPPSKVFSESMSWINQFIGSSDSNERKAALGALTVLSRGCSGLMAENLNTLLNFFSIFLLIFSEISGNLLKW
jgi:hypothetical protein